MKIKVNNDRQGFTDTKDCTVRALSNGFNLPYATAHEIAERAGRKDGKGFNTNDLLNFYKKESKKAFVHVILPFPITTEKFMELTGQRTQIVKTNKHVFVSKKNVIHDHMEPKSSPLVAEYWVVGVDTYVCPIAKQMPKVKKFQGKPTQENVITFLSHEGYTPPPHLLQNLQASKNQMLLTYTQN